MTTLRDAARQALEALEVARPLMQPVNFRDWGGPRAAAYEQHGRAITALRDALAQEEQEPVAWRYQNSNTDHVYLVWKKGTGGRNWTPLYTTPPRREWRSLSEEEIDDLSRTMVKGHKSVNWLTRAVEAKLKEKNHG